MLKTAIFAIGEELLDGSIVDTNTSYIASTLMSVGVAVDTVKLLPDEKHKIASAVQEALKTYPLVITTGGLGPTFDDLTAESIALAFNVKTVFNEKAFEHMKNRLDSYKVPVNQGHRHQVMLPEGCALIQNNNGTAMGFIMDTPVGATVSLPGVPYEMRPMMRDSVMEFIKAKFHTAKPFMADLRFADLSESYVDDIISEVGIPRGTKCIINASMGEIIVRVRDEDHERGAEFAGKIKERLKDRCFADGTQKMEEMLVELLLQTNKTVSVAESCTGGLLGGAVTSVPGSSNVFGGGVISYSNEIKIQILGVDKDIIATAGAVSEECAVAMAAGVKKLTGADCAISVTGIAGPGGGTPEKPVGTVYICVISGSDKRCKRYKFSGERDAVRTRAVKTGLRDLYLLIKNIELK